jgi:YbbR domain-containing protein
VTTVRAAVLRVILAALLAFALWIFVSYTQNPDVTSSFEGVPVELEGLAPGMLVVDTDGQPRTGRATVDLTVDADEETLRNLTVSDLRAFIDLTDRGPGEHSVPINVVPTRSGLQRARFSAEPDFLLIRLDQEITRTVPLSIEITGSVPFGFEAGDPDALVSGRQLEAVTVRGPQGRVERVVSAQISADIDRLTANYNSPRTPEAVAADGEIVTGVTVDPPSVNLVVPISSSVGVKRVPVVPVLAGQPAAGFVVTGVTLEPQLVTLTGSSGPLDAVDSVSTLEVSVAGATETFTRTVPIAEPVNSRFGFGEPTSAVVTVQVEPIARPFQVTLPVSVQVVDIPSGLLVQLSPQVVQARLAGTSRQLASLDPSSLTGVVSAADLRAGSYRRVPALQLPAGVVLVEDLPAVTLTLRQPATATDEPDDPGEPATETPADATPLAGTPTTSPTTGPLATTQPGATALPPDETQTPGQQTATPP